MIYIKDKVVLVTGAQRGIGRATIIEFARHGYNVVIDYYEEEERAFALKRYVEEQYGIRALPISADIRMRPTLIIWSIMP